jgi:glucose/arabinose dehydrogenase
VGPVPGRVLAVLLLSVLVGCGSGDSAGARTEPVTSIGPPAREAASKATRLVQVGTFESPVYVTSPPQDERRLFVVEQAGRIMVVRDGKKLATPFLDIRSLVTSGGEQGLLSVAFPPDYASSKRFYVYYTDRSGDQRIVEYQASSADRADAGSARQVLHMADPEVNHNGGLLLFGPDKLMYVGTGDGGGGGDRHGSRGNAQSLGSLLGKILRIDPRESGGRPYTVPSSNPFVGRSGARGEIYAYGLRNPWRFSFDRRTGDLVIADVGQNAIEEVDFVRRGGGRGANFGWRVFEGRSRYTEGEKAPGAIAPVIETSHADGNCSITGGVVVRDRALAGLYGRYVFGDLCKPRLVSARLARPRAKDVRTTKLRVDQVSSFGEDARGHVYAVSLSGPVYRLAPK